MPLTSFHERIGLCVRITKQHTQYDVAKNICATQVLTELKDKDYKKQSIADTQRHPSIWWPDQALATAGDALESASPVLIAHCPWRQGLQHFHCTQSFVLTSLGLSL